MTAVASHLKKDKRSIEETLADIRAKKRRLKDEESAPGAADAPAPADAGGS